MHEVVLEIIQRGDGPLSRSGQDPWDFIPPPPWQTGLRISVTSTPPTGMMTWGELRTTLDGLKKVLYYDGINYDCQFDIFHTAHGFQHGKGFIARTGLSTIDGTTS